MELVDDPTTQVFEAVHKLNICLRKCMAFKVSYKVFEELTGIKKNINRLCIYDLNLGIKTKTILGMFDNLRF